ncbi:unnamed protein product [Pedinophyceae sp. YPF-701]|nr:unnamed protein product [Pedinophyceae sp. YPF-701]
MGSSGSSLRGAGTAAIRRAAPPSGAARAPKAEPPVPSGASDAALRTAAPPSTDARGLAPRPQDGHYLAERDHKLDEHLRVVQSAIKDRYAPTVDLKAYEEGLVLKQGLKARRAQENAERLSATDAMRLMQVRAPAPRPAAALRTPCAADARHCLGGDRG